MRLCRKTGGKPAQHRLGGVDRRHADPIQKPQCAAVIIVPMAEDDRIDPPDRAEIRQAAGLGAFAAIEQQALSVRFDHEGGGLLGSETRYGDQARGHFGSH